MLRLRRRRAGLRNVAFAAAGVSAVLGAVPFATGAIARLHKRSVEARELGGTSKKTEGPAGAGPSCLRTYGLTLTIVEPISLLPSL